jgi:hypothetical protein
MKTKEDFNGLVLGSRVRIGGDIWYTVNHLGDSSLRISEEGGEEFEIQYEQIDGWTDYVQV